LGRWYCLYTMVRSEAKAADKLRDAGYCVFAPIYRKRVKIMRAGRRRERITEIPLLSRYIFIEMEHDDSWQDVTDTDGVGDFLRGHANIPAPVPLHAIEDLMAAQDMGLFDETRKDLPIFDPGDHVQILEGPFAGFPAEVARAIGGETAKVFVTMFGGRVPLHTEIGNLRRAA